MLRFSRLQSALIVGVCLLGLLLSVPNFLRPGALPAWIPQRTVNLGLDLQGGSYLVLEIELENGCEGAAAQHPQRNTSGTLEGARAEPGGDRHRSGREHIIFERRRHSRCAHRPSRNNQCQK